MNRDDIIRMAQEAGLHIATDHDWMPIIALAYAQKFAELVRAEEREACAKVCDEKVEAEYATGKVDHNEMGWTQACAITIRARGQG